MELTLRRSQVLRLTLESLQATSTTPHSCIESMKTSVMAHRRFRLAAVIGTFSSSLLQWVGRIADSQLLYKSPIETNRPCKPRLASNKEKSFRSQLRFIITVGPSIYTLSSESNSIVIPIQLFTSSQAQTTFTSSHFKLLKNGRIEGL